MKVSLWRGRTSFFIVIPFCSMYRILVRGFYISWSMLHHFKLSSAWSPDTKRDWRQLTGSPICCFSDGNAGRLEQTDSLVRPYVNLLLSEPERFSAQSPHRSPRLDRMCYCISTSAFALKPGQLELGGTAALLTPDELNGRVELNSLYIWGSNKHSPHDCNLDYPGPLFKKERLNSLRIWRPLNRPRRFDRKNRLLKLASKQEAERRKRGSYIRSTH